VKNKKKMRKVAKKKESEKLKLRLKDDREGVLTRRRKKIINNIKL
jgi:hypothetical protein